MLYVSVPVELLTTGYNLLEILSYVRLTDDEGCRDDYNGANWVKIADTTCLRIYYEISDDADELYMYPYPFISLMNPDGAESAVARQRRGGRSRADRRHDADGRAWATVCLPKTP